MRKLITNDEIALMYAPTSEELLAYLHCFRLEPASELKLLELAEPEVLAFYLTKYSLRDENEASFVQAANEETVKAYFAEWPLSAKGQEQLLADAKLPLVMAYIQRYAFAEPIEPMLFKPELKEAAAYYAKIYPLFAGTEMKMMDMGDADIIASYIAHDELHEAAELKLFDFPLLVPLYLEKWTFGAKAAERYVGYLAETVDAFGN